MSPFKTNTKKDYYKPRKLEIKKKQSEDKIIRAIKYSIIRDIKNLFEQKEHFQKSVRVGNFYSNNYIKYKSNSDRNKPLSIK